MKEGNGEKEEGREEGREGGEGRRKWGEGRKGGEERRKRGNERRQEGGRETCGTTWRLSHPHRTKKDLLDVLAVHGQTRVFDGRTWARQ